MLSVAGTGDWTQKYCLPCCQVFSSHLEAPNGFSHFEIFQWIISKIYSHSGAAEIFTFQWLISKSYSHLGAVKELQKLFTLTIIICSTRSRDTIFVFKSAYEPNSEINKVWKWWQGWCCWWWGGGLWWCCWWWWWQQLIFGIIMILLLRRWGW